jgi:hypothetical protein
MAAGAVDTHPFCGSCGFDYTTAGHKLPPGYLCDACGADLTYTSPNDIGPTNPPSAPTATDATGGVARFSFTAAPNFDSYNFRYSLDGEAYAYLYDVTSPIDVTDQSGVEVCGSLQGAKDGLLSGWSADNCVTPA